MLRLSFFIIASALVVTSQVQALEKNTTKQEADRAGIEQVAEVTDTFTALEYELIKQSGLLSLSQQVKDSAQSLIATSIEGAAKTSEAVSISHAQHFAIAKNLSKRWSEEHWQQRLLTLVHAIPERTQQKIQQQLTHPLIQDAQRKEKAAIGVQDSPEYRLYINKLRQRPPAASRWKLVENLDAQSRFADIIIQTRRAVIKEIQQQVKGWQPEPSWEKQVRQDVLEFLFYAYRKTPNDGLKRITESFKQPELSQFYKDVLNLVK